MWCYNKGNLETENSFRVSGKGEREMNEIKEKIINAVIEEFGNKGLKFTMDDIAKNLGMSKKTLYNVYANKEEMLLEMADSCFADIKRSEREIAEDPNMDIATKIEKIMVVLPDRYQNIGLSNLYQLQEKFPNIYGRIANYLATDWDVTIALLEEGMQQGVIRPISIPIVKTMVEGTIQKFFAEDVLVENGIGYEEALQEMISIIMRGIKE